MRTFLSNQKNDLILNGIGNLEIVEGINAVSQTSRQYMQTRRGEMIHDILSGIPFDLLVWNGAPNIPQFEAAARVRLRQVPGVISVQSFEVKMIGDTLDYVTTLNTQSGEVTFNA